MKMTPEQKALFDALTPLQKEVCPKVLAGMKPIDAYKASSSKASSSGSAKSAVSEMLKRPAVVEFMDAMQEAAVSSALMTRQEAMERLSTIARVSVTDIAEFDTHDVETANGVVRQTIWRMKDSGEISEAAALAIKSVTMTKFGPKLELHDRLSAIQQLARMQGWEAAQKFDLTSSDGSMSPKGKSLDDFYGNPDVPAKP